MRSALPGRDGALDAVVLSLFEDAVALQDLVQGQAVGDERVGVDAAALDKADQLRAVGGVHTAGTEGQVLAVHQVQGQALRFFIREYC